MSDVSSLKRKWDRRYHQSSLPQEPCWVLKNNLHLLPATGSSLDLACGLGANAICLADQGLESHAWDISTTALEKLSNYAQHKELSIKTSVRNVELEPPEEESFDVIVVSQFLYRPIFPALVSALKPGGLLFYQTFNKNKLTNSGPNNPQFLLDNNELISLTAPLALIFYREDGSTGKLEQGLRNCSYLVAKKTD